MADSDVPARERFGPERIALLPVLFLFVGSLPLAASSPALTWVLLVPVACAVWVWRARVVVAPVGIEVCNGLGVTRLRWADVEGFEIPRRGPVRLLRRGRRPVPMTAVPRRSVPALTAAAARVSGAVAS